MDRRTFLKITGLGSAAFAAGCADPKKNLYTLVQAPDDMVTGRATWYASTCRECPAGCGVLAKNREGRVIKLEGNPLHPVNRGKLCARGQSALQALYNPDRITTPQLRSEGAWQSIGFDQALTLLQQRMAKASAKGSGRIRMLSEVVGQSLLDLFTQVLAAHNGHAPLIFEPLAFESLKFAHRQVFGRPILPGLHMERADVLVSFGADFLETWLSPVEYARKFKAMHAVENGRKGLFLHISPYQSLTAANADRWFGCRPGSEAAIVMLIIQRAMKSGRDGQLSESFRNALKDATRPYSLEEVSRLSDVPAGTLEKLINKVLTARMPLVLGSATACHGTSSVALDLAVTLLNVLLDPQLSLYDFDQRHRVEIAHTRTDIEDFWIEAAGTSPDLLMLNNVNPLYGLPGQSKAAEVLNGRKTFVVAFANFMDETADAADLIFPTQLPLETWDIYESKQAMASALQPAMGVISKAPALGDLFLGLLPDELPSGSDYRHFLFRRLEKQKRMASTADWMEMVQNGGQFVAGRQSSRPAVKLDRRLPEMLAGLLGPQPSEVSQKTSVYLTPSLRHYDGRGANRPWLSEIPDPVTQIAWQTPVWIPKKKMQANGWTDGTELRLASPHGEIEAAAYGHGGLHDNAIAIPMGMGHTLYGRYAKGQGVDPVTLMGTDTVTSAGAPAYAMTLDKISATGKTRAVASTSGSRIQHARKIALSVPIDEATQSAAHGKGLAMNDFPFTLPLPQGYDHHRDIYEPHEHDTYRWGMVVDLDRCIGCSACVAGCYAENNIGMVGEQQIIKGREMAWLSIQRYEDPQDPAKKIFLPMMCQQCDNAPCEPVCPVYAPHHSKEGLNNQVYNRCIGTRFCAQNCPYKVRRFNWLKWQWPEPLNMQLNPNVTVRTAGVMEKCSFCVQRIKVAHGHAKDENRTIRDGEVVPACVQTCPTNALYFGNLMDEQSTVRKLITDPRAYQVMGYINTKPAVIYLKKVTQSL